MTERAAALPMPEAPLQTARDALAAHLAPGERLLAGLPAVYRPSDWLAWPVWLGMSERRFLLVRADQPERAYSLPLALVQAAHYRRGWLPAGGGALTLRLPGGQLMLELPDGWGAIGRAAARAWADWSASPAAAQDEWHAAALARPATAELLGCARDLRDLGLLAAARGLLRRRIDADPLSGAQRRGLGLLRQIETALAAERLTALLLLAAGLFQVHAALRGYPAGWFGLALLGCVFLWLLRGQAYAREASAGLGAGLAGFNAAWAAALHGLPEASAWGGFALALLLLAGPPRATRLAWAGALALAASALALSGAYAWLLPTGLFPASPEALGMFISH